MASYWVYATDKQIEALSRQLQKGWYAHLWKEQKPLSVFPRTKFKFRVKNKSTWNEAVEYGKSSLNILRLEA
jgi:hypothetical protein